MKSPLERNEFLAGRHPRRSDPEMFLKCFDLGRDIFLAPRSPLGPVPSKMGRLESVPVLGVRWR